MFCIRHEEFAVEKKPRKNFQKIFLHLSGKSFTPFWVPAVSIYEVGGETAFRTETGRARRVSEASSARPVSVRESRFYPHLIESLF